MPISAPPDYSKTFVIIAVGAGIALCLFILTRSTLPSVGDNIHQLPHGGTYVDGTKRINYCGPNKEFPSSNLFNPGSNFGVLLLVITLIFAIHVLSGRETTIRSNCGCIHHSSRN
ncbi:triple gene block protein 2 [Garlic yellow mosaic-associated virus]|nr:triple gene block protein 2 [Garlic yellow mosaic-associated virus]